MRRGVSMTTFIFVTLLIVAIPNELRNLFVAEAQVNSRFLVAPLLGMTSLIEPEPGRTDEGVSDYVFRVHGEPVPSRQALSTNIISWPWQVRGKMSQRTSRRCGRKSAITNTAILCSTTRKSATSI